MTDNRCLSRLLGIVPAAVAAMLLIPTLALAAGPPARPALSRTANRVVVYDYANLLSPAEEAQATATITAIEKRTGAEVAIYTQYKPGSDEDSTRDDAKALIDQWGVGRAGFYDGLVILINMNRTSSACPTSVAMARSSSMPATATGRRICPTQERQAIFDNDMKPLLVECDFDGAIMAALDKIDANATPEHAADAQHGTHRRRRGRADRRAAVADPDRRMGERGRGSATAAIRCTSMTRRS